MLKEYSSKPCTVLACEILEEGKVEGSKAKGYTYTCKGVHGITTLMKFEATVKPEVGDFIIELSKNDVYHCPKDVFEKKYSTTRMLIQ